MKARGSKVEKANTAATAIHLATALLVGGLLTAVGGCGEGSQPPATTAQQTASAVTVTQTAGAVTSIVTAVQAAPAGDKLAGRPGPDAQVSLASKVGQGLSDGPSCITISPVAPPPSVKVVFHSCTMPNGQSIDGELTLIFNSLLPVDASLSLTRLTIGQTTLDGTMRVMVSSLGTATVETQLTGSRNGSTATLSGLKATISQQGVRVDGGASISSSSASTSAKIAALNWAWQCLPSSGSVTIDAITTITFLPTTPFDGAVQVQVGSLPPTTETLFAPCNRS